MNKLNIYLKGIELPEDTKKSVQRNLTHLFSFSQLENRLKHPRDFFFIPSSNFYDSCENNVQNAAVEILSHCNLDRISVKIIYDLLEKPKEYKPFGFNYEQHTAGKTYILNKYQYTIYLNKEYGPKFRAAILAHEISHVYIAFNNIQLKTKSLKKQEFLEQMTDLCTIALGLGKLVLVGTSYLSTFLSSYLSMYEDPVYHVTLGYLNKRVLNYANVLVKASIKQVKKTI